MRLWARVFLGYFLIVGLAGWFLLRVFVSEVKPGVRDAVEDVMIDTANLLAELARDDLLARRLPDGRFAASVEAYRQRPIKAKIWGLEKQTLDFRIYVTDAAGIVRYDSENRAIGEDYSNWRDVALTLRGEYGARSTRDNPEDETSGVMHVAAAIHDWSQVNDNVSRADGRMEANEHPGRIVGVVTVAKPSRTLAPIIARGERAMLRHGLLLLGATLVIGALFTAWLTISVGKLLRYARALSAGQPATPPSRGRDEIGELARALAQLRDEVDGRAYIERYVQHLTHEMKSPLAAIHGAAELLAEAGLPEGERQRFANNALAQSERLQTLIQTLLRLAQIEQQRALDAPTTIDLAELLAEQQAHLATQAARKRVVFTLTAAPALPAIRGDRFLLGLALTNLLQNALDFSPPGSVVECTLARVADHAADHAAADAERVGARVENWLEICIRDYGPGIPDYAHTRLFERFFSLPRPDGAPRSSGLGLPLVHEIAALHGGTVTLENVNHTSSADDTKEDAENNTGALARLRLPLHPASP